MNEEFEKLESVDEMFDFLADKGDEPEVNHLFMEELSILNAQIFIKCFDQYRKLSEKLKKELEQCALYYNDDTTDFITRQSALAYVCELLFGIPKENRQIGRKNDKKYTTPCEDCEATPTHLVQFKEDDRTEEHYLCENCEAAVKAGKDDNESDE